MAPQYKLIYFNVYGVAEPIRFIFAYLNLDYEDVRISPEEWPTIKPTTPFGKIPVLEIDGEPISQSVAIARYLANQHGLTGKDAWESLQCDVLVDTFKDFTQGVIKLFTEKDEEKKEELRKTIMENDVPFYFGKFNKIVADNPENYLIGSQVTWADLFFAASLGGFEQLKPGILEPFPALSSHVQKINNIPGIKTWIEKRPSNPRTLKL